LWQVATRDANGNVTRGSAHILDCNNCLVYADGTVAAVAGGKDLIIIATADAVMVTRRDRAQSVKDLVSDLKLARRPEATRHKRNYRDWGSEETIHSGETFSVTHLILDPGGTLAPQNKHGGMHWVVVRGSGKLRNEGQLDRKVIAGQSVELTGCRLLNTGDEYLELIAIETGLS
jgi:mannose-1-phosphate guanylyltransferase/mannose-1-phosphate guanylyltransferase/mannose-6-phosphate isomerase